MNSNVERLAQNPKVPSLSALPDPPRVPEYYIQKQPAWAKYQQDHDKWWSELKQHLERLAAAISNSTTP